MEPHRSRDPRDASDTIAGFNYQFSQTLLAWLKLAQSEALWIEVGEDFSVVSESGTTTSQVRHVRRARAISLAQKKLRDSLNNFWIQRGASADKTLSLRFLTNAVRGIEKGSPFGKVAGLDLWDRGRSDLAAVSEVKDYLLSQPLAPELRQFLRTADLSAVKNELIASVQWVTGAGDLATTQELCRRRIEEFIRAETNYLPLEVDKIFDALFGRVVATSSKAEGRLLTFEDLRRVAREAVTIKFIPDAQSVQLASEVQAALARIGFPDRKSVV